MNKINDGVTHVLLIRVINWFTFSHTGVQK